MRRTFRHRVYLVAQRVGFGEENLVQTLGLVLVSCVQPILISVEKPVVERFQIRAI